MAKEAAHDRGAAEDTGSDRGEVTARKKARPAPRRKVSKTTKAAGATGTPKTRKAPAARASAAPGASKQRAAAPRTRTGRTKGTGVTRKKQKKNRS
jgi:hypothetical protein